MFSNLKLKLAAFGMAGMAWLGGHSGCGDTSFFGGYADYLPFGGGGGYYADPYYGGDFYYEDYYYQDDYYYDGGYWW